MKVKALYINSDGIIEEKKATLTHEGKLLVKFGRKRSLVWDAKGIKSILLHKLSILSLFTLFIIPIKKYVPAYIVHPKIKIPLEINLNVGSPDIKENSGLIKYSTPKITSDEIDLTVLDKFMKTTSSDIKMMFLIFSFIAGAIFTYLLIGIA